MIQPRFFSIALAASIVASCQSWPHPTRDAPYQPRPRAAEATAAAEAAPPPEPHTSTTIIPGQGVTAPAMRAGGMQLQRGDISLNFPSVEVETAAKAVLGDVLRMPYDIAPGVKAQVSVVTPYPLARASVLAFFEDALKPAGLALVSRGEGVSIMTLDAARGQSAGGGIGFGSETVSLKFVGADAMKKLIDPVLPGVVTGADAASNTITLSGTSGQRASVRDLLRQFDVNWLRGMSFALLVPQRGDARLIVPELDKLLNGDAAPTRGLVRLIAMEKLNGVLAISAQAQYLEDVRRWVEVLDREGQNNEKRLFVYRVQNGRSDDLAKVLNRAFGGGGGSSSPRKESSNAFDSATRAGSEDRAPERSGSGDRGSDKSAASDSSGGGVMDARISSDETNNAIIVYGTPRDYAVIEDALRKLDIMPVQVMVEAAITEVQLNDNLRYGVQWSFTEGDANFTLGEGSTASAADALTRTFPGFSVFYSNNNSVRATLNALEGLTSINVISAPKLMVLNNQTAALQVGDQVPVATGSAIGVQNANAPIVNTIEYRDTGVILKITPRVNSSGMVLLDVLQEVSSVSRSSGTIQSPTISTRRVASTIAVQDGNVIALGGLITDNSNQGKNGLPYLSRIPVLGPLAFGNRTSDGRRTELIVLLRPRVIRSASDGRAITDELRSRIRSIAPYNQPDSIP